MKTDDVTKVYKALHAFRKLAAENAWKFVVGGSIALREIGLIDRVPQDVDLDLQLPEDDSESEKVFRTLILASGAETEQKYPDKPITFIIQGVKFNVWVVKEINYSATFEIKGFRFSLPMKVLCHKASYKRPKDYEDFDSIMAKLLLVKLGK